MNFTTCLFREGCEFPVDRFLVEVALNLPDLDLFKTSAFPFLAGVGQEMVVTDPKEVGAGIERVDGCSRRVAAGHFQVESGWKFIRIGRQTVGPVGLQVCFRS
ncbi:MAG: hypothetical protein V4689_18305 [Verrucomicrobiota bacterium]